MRSGLVEQIVLRDARGESARPVGSARAVAGRGLEGDVAFAEFEDEDVHEDDRELTLIQAEALEGLAAEHGIPLTAAEARRNVVTRGIELNELVGRRFRVGDVECVGRELCDPCSHLQSTTYPGVLRGLVGRGGLRAAILTGGEIAVGDPVVELG